MRKMDFIVVLDGHAQKTAEKNAVMIEHERETFENERAARVKRYADLLGKGR